MSAAPTEASITAVTVRLRARDGREVELRVSPETYDALFLSLDVVDRMLVPFYATAKEGLEDALSFRKEVQEEYTRSGGTIVVLHQRYCKRRLVQIDWDRPSVEL